MSCRVHEDIDMTRYLLEPKAAEFDGFRAHYPSCSTCSREVQAWTVLERALARPSPETGAGQAPWHPDPEALARFAGGPGAAGSEAETMRRHIDTCAPCRTEWRSLQGFDFAGAMDAPWQTAASASAAVETPGLVERLIDWLGLGIPARAAMGGALAMTAVLAISWWALGPELEPARDAGTMAQQSPPAATPSEAIPPVRGPQPVPGPREIAEAPSVPDVSQPVLAEAVPEPVIEAPSAPVADSIQLARSETGSPGSQAVPAVEEDEHDEKESPAGVPASVVVGDEILLASLSKMPPPDYAAPSGASELAWMHQFGSVRSTSRGAGSPSVRAHAPDHIGLTQQAAPRLWWSLSDTAPQSVTITLVDDREIDPLLEVEIPGPQSAGLSSIDLAGQGIELEPGVEYRWFVTLVIDAERPSRNQISAGSIKRVPLDPAAQKSIDDVAPAERGHALARQGYWYDSYDFFADLSARHPDASAPGTFRERLLAEATVAP